MAGAPEPDEAAADDPELRDRAARLLAAGYGARDIADILAAETSLPRREMYALALKESKRLTQT